MDEMKLKLSTKVMRRFVADMVAKTIFNKFGIKPEIDVNTIELEMVSGKLTFHVDANGSFNQNEILKLTRVINKK